MTLFDDTDQTAWLSFYVPGTPVPQGSKRWLPNGAMIEANKGLRPWRATVTSYVMQAMKARLKYNADVSFPMFGPVSVIMDFTFTRPKSHYRTGKNAGLLKTNAPRYVTSTPDLDKLIRSIQDGITDAGLWKDDSQVVTLSATKTYADQPGVTVSLVEVHQ